MLRTPYLNVLVKELERALTEQFQYIEKAPEEAKPYYLAAIKDVTIAIAAVLHKTIDPFSVDAFYANAGYPGTHPVHTGIVEEPKKIVNNYARVFDENSPKWYANHDLNMVFLRASQHYANQLLQTSGYVFLNDVFDQLGFEKTSVGQLVGWLNNEEHKSHVDFGLDKKHDHTALGLDKEVFLLDFNVDGVIYDKIEKRI